MASNNLLRAIVCIFTFSEENVALDGDMGLFAPLIAPLPDLGTSTQYGRGAMSGANKPVSPRPLHLSPSLIPTKTSHSSSLLFSLLFVLLFSACGTTIPTNTSTPAPTSTPIMIIQPNTTPAIKTIGIFRAYALPQAQSGIMRPAIDHQGRIWFGEMGHNALAVFDPHTGLVQQWVPPHGRRWHHGYHCSNRR